MPTTYTPVNLLEAIGGERGCRDLSAQFYSRIAKEQILRPLFPGKSLRCATEEFAAFLIQFLGGDENQTQFRWWLSLRESHSRFRIDSAQRNAWLKCMRATLKDAQLDESTRQSLIEFFQQSSAYVVGEDSIDLKDSELAARWKDQRILDETITAISSGIDADATTFASRFADRPSMFVGLLARMVQSHRSALIEYVVDCVNQQPLLCSRFFSGRTLLHFASGYGCLEVVAELLRLGADPNCPDSGGHTPLYSVANECSSESGPKIVETLVQARADVNACGGVTRATALHMAARRGHVDLARALISFGAKLEAKDRKGDTPLRRALNCRQDNVAKLLVEFGAAIPK